jgi:hypothetical protein
MLKKHVLTSWMAVGWKRDIKAPVEECSTVLRAGQAHLDLFFSLSARDGTEDFIHAGKVLYH